MPAPRKYSNEVREQAMRQVAEAREQDPELSLNAAVKRIAARVGIVLDTLRGWCRQAEVDAGQWPGTTTSDAVKIRELEREVKELKRANEILLAASSFFAQELALLLVLLLTTCTDGAHSRQAKSTAPNSAGTATASPTTLGRPGCRPPSPIGRGKGFPEVQGTSDQIQMWGLIKANGPDNPLRTNEEVKIVWRITGSGPLHLTILDPSGRAHQLLWGPDPHLSPEPPTELG